MYILYTNHSYLGQYTLIQSSFLHGFCSPFWDTPMWHTQSTRLGLCQSSWGWTLDLIALNKLSFTIGFHGISWDFGEILLGFCWDFMGFIGFTVFQFLPLGAPWVLRGAWRRIYFVSRVPELDIEYRRIPFLTRYSQALERFVGP